MQTKVNYIHYILSHTQGLYTCQWLGLGCLQVSALFQQLSSSLKINLDSFHSVYVPISFTHARRSIKDFLFYYLLCDMIFLGSQFSLSIFWNSIASNKFSRIFNATLFLKMKGPILNGNFTSEDLLKAPKCSSEHNLFLINSNEKNSRSQKDG